MYNFLIKERVKSFLLVSIFFFTSASFSSTVEYGIRWKNSFEIENLKNEFDNLHEEMSRREKVITGTLQDNNGSKNIVLASISIIYENKAGHRQTKIIKIPSEEKAFISGTKDINNSHFMVPTDDAYITTILLDRITSLNNLITSKENILSAKILTDMTTRSDAIHNLLANQKKYNEIKGRIVGYSTSSNWKTLSDSTIKDELKKIDTCLSSLSNLELYTCLNPESQTIKIKLEQIKNDWSELSNEKKAIDKANLAFKGCADAEQHLMAYLSKYLDQYYNKIFMPESDYNKIELISLHIHSRFDVCQFCAPCLWIELHRDDGFLKGLQNEYIRQKPPIAIFVSSREELKDAKRRDFGKEDSSKLINQQDISKFVYQKTTDNR